MRRLTAWVGGALGGLAAYRWLRRRPEVAAEPSSEPPLSPESTEPDERAEELRARLEESRASNEPSPAEPAEPEEPGEPPAAVEERRQRVHEEGRAALDEMKSDNSGS